MSTERVSIVDIAESGTNSVNSNMIGGAKTGGLGVPRGLLFRKKTGQPIQQGQTGYETISFDMFNTLFDKITLKEPALASAEAATTSAIKEPAPIVSEPSLKKRARSKKTRKITHTPKKRASSKKTRRLHSRG